MCLHTNCPRNPGGFQFLRSPQTNPRSAGLAPSRSTQRWMKRCPIQVPSVLKKRAAVLHGATSTRAQHVSTQNLGNENMFTKHFTIQLQLQNFNTSTSCQLPELDLVQLSMAMATEKNPPAAASRWMASFQAMSLATALSATLRHRTSTWRNGERRGRGKASEFFVKNVGC